MSGKEIKVKWRVDPEPTGRYRAFERRHWPSANYADGRSAAFIYSDGDDYTPSKARTGQHGPLTVCFHDYSTTPSTRKRLKATFATLDLAKKAFAELLRRRPEIAGVKP